jgi:hypothetical protein
MRGLETNSFRNLDNPRKREDRAELAKNVCEIVIERALDGNPICIEIFQKARRLTQQK